MVGLYFLTSQEGNGGEAMRLGQNTVKLYEQVHFDDGESAFGKG